MTYLDRISQEIAARLVAAHGDDLVLDHVVELAVEHRGLLELRRRAPSTRVAALVTEAAAADLAQRLGLLPFPDALQAAARALPEVLRPGAAAELVGSATAWCPPVVNIPRLLAPRQAVSDRAAALTEVIDAEWAGRQLESVTAGGDELVLACGRLRVAAALVAAALVAVADEVAVNAARRYAWRWLRGPLPEAVVPAHRDRTHELARNYLATVAVPA